MADSEGAVPELLPSECDNPDLWLDVDGVHGFNLDYSYEFEYWKASATLDGIGAIVAAKPEDRPGELFIYFFNTSSDPLFRLAGADFTATWASLADLAFGTDARQEDSERFGRIALARVKAEIELGERRREAWIRRVPALANNLEYADQDRTEVQS
jgi:hypothetical protein